MGALRASQESQAQLAQQHLVSNRSAEESLNKAKIDALAALQEQERSSKGKGVAIAAWSKAVDEKTQAEAKAKDAESAYLKLKEDVDQQIAALAEKEAASKVEKVKADLLVVAKTENAEQLRLTAVSAGELDVQKAKALRAAEELVQHADAKLTAQSQVSQQASDAAENAWNAFQHAQNEVDQIKMDLATKKGIQEKLEDLEDSVRLAFKRVQDLEDDVREEEEKTKANAWDIIKSEKHSPKLKQSLQAYNAVAMSLEIVQKSSPEMFSKIVEGIEQVDRDFDAVLKITCDPARRLQKQGKFEDHCGSSLYKHAGVQKVDFPIARGL
eukprot:TRINITY_DN33215_c0_g1_i2.p1 TRINITY_DN33215_c0_g1~~TRINITY_DN33215_c0_g1_i2.p1  ORF type:complete len:327 (-),score=90.49 TRINITY_DN33215_c0_g1_i2:277-1257(-)